MNLPFRAEPQSRRTGSGVRVADRSQPEGLVLEPTAWGASIVLQRNDARDVEKTVVDGSRLPRSRCYDSLYRYIAQQFGARIVAAYSTLGLLPADAAAELQRTLAATCAERARR